MRQQVEGERGFARWSIGDGGSNGEPVMPMRQAVVIGHPPRHRTDPLAVQPFQTIGIPHAFGSAQINTGVPELQPAVTRRQSGLLAYRNRASIHDHFEQMNHGRRRRNSPVVRIEYGQSEAGGKPQASVVGSGATSAGGISRSALCAAQAVRHAVVHWLDCSDLSALQIPDILFPHAANTPRGAQPQRAVAIVLNVRNVVAQQTVARRDVEKLPVA